MQEFRLFGLPTASFVARFPNGRRIGFESIPFPADIEQAVWWIDNKAVMKKKLRALGLPVAHGESAYTLARAKRIFKGLQGKAITKPAEGSASRHTTLHICDEAALERGFRVAKEVSPFVVIEEELEGSVYRPTLVRGQLIATIRRDPPRVVGDGIHTVKELIEEANKHPKRQGPYFSHIKMTELGEKELVLQKLNLQSVPSKGQVVYLHPKINWALGGTTTDVTDSVHPDNKALFEEIARVLHAPIVGIDFITSDISRSWKETPKCGVIETNGRPFFDNHHLPFEGEPRNVAGVIWGLYEAQGGKN
jgi:cyanophycin synthetase